MTDGLRLVAYTLLAALILLCLLVAGWVAWSRQQLHKFRMSDARMKAMKESQRNKRPRWQADPSNPKETPRAH
jgi:predicted negative regulator of RcsB-dependent stress response